MSIIEFEVFTYVDDHLYSSTPHWSTPHWSTPYWSNFKIPPLIDPPLIDPPLINQLIDRPPIDRPPIDRPSNSLTSIHRPQIRKKFVHFCNFSADFSTIFTIFATIFYILGLFDLTNLT
jgi:hypothetical protein